MGARSDVGPQDTLLFGDTGYIEQGRSERGNALNRPAGHSLVSLKSFVNMVKQGTAMVLHAAWTIEYCIVCLPEDLKTKSLGRCTHT